MIEVIGTGMTTLDGMICVVRDVQETISSFDYARNLRQFRIVEDFYQVILDTVREPEVQILFAHHEHLKADGVKIWVTHLNNVHGEALIEVSVNLAAQVTAPIVASLWSGRLSCIQDSYFARADLRNDLAESIRLLNFRFARM